MTMMGGPMDAPIASTAVSSVDPLLLPLVRLAVNTKKQGCVQVALENTISFQAVFSTLDATQRFSRAAGTLKG
jgi:hypothetical protein